jgi:RNA polymerase sigma-70 factor (ECF subfamily)
MPPAARGPVPSPDEQPGSDQFNQWLSTHVAVLYKVAYRMLGNAHDAEDVLQDTFRSAWTSRHLYDQARSERAWLMAILRRRVADHWRRHESREKCVAAEFPQPGTVDADPFAAELSACLQRALDRLPEELRETLLLVIVGELTHQEAADLQGIPLGTVLSRVSRARSRLREFMLESTSAAQSRTPG